MINKLGLKLRLYYYEGKWCFSNIFVIGKEEYIYEYRGATRKKPTYFDIFYFEE